MVFGYPTQPEDGPKHAKPEEWAPAELAPDQPELPGLDESVALPKEPEVVLKQFGIPWKSIIAFAGVFIGQLVARSTVDGVAVLPSDFKGLLSLIGGSIVAAAVVYFKANVYTVPQAQKLVEVAYNRAA